MSQIRPVIEHLTGRKHLVLFDKREDVERHLIATHAIGELKVVAAPRHITDAIGEDSRHDIDILLKRRRRIDGERGTGLIARQRLNGRKIKRVHNLCQQSYGLCMRTEKRGYFSFG